MTRLPATIRGLLRLSGFLALTVLFALGVGATRRLRPEAAAGLARLWNAGACRLAGLRVGRRGEPARGSVLFVANHVSYLDVCALRSLVRASFVAKREVASWPLFGWIARLGDSVFVGRSPLDGRSARASAEERLAQDQSLVLFPEGTSSDGAAVLPFKSSLFELARPRPGRPPIVVQPVTLHYRDGGPARRGSSLEPTPYAWFGDMALVPHLWRVFRGRDGAVVVAFHPPFALDAGSCRKAAAARAHAAVARGLTVLRLEHGRRVEEPPIRRAA